MSKARPLDMIHTDSPTTSDAAGCLIAGALLFMVAACLLYPPLVCIAGPLLIAALIVSIFL